MSILRGPHAMVRPVSPVDYDELRSMELHGVFGEARRFGGRTPSPHDHVTALWQGVLLQSVALDPVTEAIVGLLTVHDADLRHGHAKVAIAAVPDAVGTGRAFAGFALFVTDLFAEWRFRTLYADASERTFATFGSGQDRIFTVEGRLAGYYRAGADTADRLLLAIERDRWMAEIGTIVQRRRRAMAHRSTERRDRLALTVASGALRAP